MKNLETELKCPEEIKEKKGISRQEKFLRFIFASSILLATTNSNHIPTEAEASGVDNKFPQGETYVLPEEGFMEEEKSIVGEVEEDQGFFSDFLIPPEEFCFIPSDASGLDSDGFVLPKETIVEDDVVEEVVVEGVLKNPFLVIEKRLSPEVKDILSLQPELNFDENGQLYYEEEGDIKPVLTVETDRFLLYSDNEQLKGVDFFVIHYDAAPQALRSGAYRTVLNTINGLNREGNPSVQFCVDSYPVNDEFEGGDGVGIIHSQPTGPIPYKGWHVVIGYELATGREDLNRVKTADLYEKLGVGQDFVDFIRAGNKDFDSFSLSLEQVGTNYSYNFPEQFPPNQQIANVLALVKAASERYGLSVWDIVGHHEIQEKSDPGDEYMLTLRFLLGLSYLSEEQLPDDFLETDDPYDFFVSLRDYSIARMGGERYSQWNDIYGLDGVIEWFENVEIEGEAGIEVSKGSADREISPEKIEFLASHEIHFGDKERPVVMMTYDDGGSEEYVRHIMEVYEKYGLRTTFFVTGQWVERNPELIKDMIDRGFEIGCHGWDHAEMTALTQEESRKQIEDFLQAMKDVDSDYKVNLIRFPFGSRNQTLREIAAEFGLQSVMWSHGSGGMDNTTFDNVMGRLGWGSIILSHSTRWYDVYETERIIQALLEQGYEISTVTEGMAEEDVYHSDLFWE